MQGESEGGMLSQNALARHLGASPEVVRGMVGAYEGQGGRLHRVREGDHSRIAISLEARGVFERAWTLMHQANLPASEALGRVLNGERRLGLERLDEALGVMVSLRGVIDELAEFKTEAARLRLSVESGRRVNLERAPEMLAVFETVVKRGEARRWRWVAGVATLSLALGLTAGYGWGQGQALQGYRQTVGELVGVFRGQDQRLKVLENRVARALKAGR